jgi:putative spermidine/putrescine transport system ATP-binding protein
VSNRLAENAVWTGHAVEIIDVAKLYGNVTAVRHVSLPVRRGEFLTLLGPSGCGKTTLLNLIAGFEPPTSGQIHIDGRDVTNVPPHRRNTGMVFQNYALFPHMSVFDNVAFGLRMRKLDKQTVKRDVERTLEMVKLSGMGNRRVKQLSGGQQQRIALARAIAFGPRVLLLDEPLSALDKNLRTQMQFELAELHEKTGLTTIFVTHDQGEALSMSDRIAVMNRGEIQQISEPLELYSRPANSFVASFIGEINRLPTARLKRQGGSVSFEFPGSLSLTVDKPVGVSLDDNESVCIFVRPEHITLADATSRAPNVVPAKIVSHIYQGTHTLTRVICDGLGQIDMRLPGGAIIDEKPAGSPVQIAFSLDRAVVLRDSGNQ